MKQPFKERIGDFMAGKGFYIVLLLCVAAIGISGYYLYTTFQNVAPVSGPVSVTVTLTGPETGATFWNVV